MSSEKVKQSYMDQRDALLAKAPHISKEEQQSLARIYEHIELLMAATSGERKGPQALDVDFYSTYLLVLFLNENLNEARFLWKRMNPLLKKNARLIKIWGIGQALWKRNYLQVYTILHEFGSDELKPLLELLEETIRERMVDLISTSYASIPFDVLAGALDTSPETLENVCNEHQWNIQERADSQRMVFFPKEEKPAHISQIHGARDFPTAEAMQLDTLAGYILHLEGFQ